MNQTDRDKLITKLVNYDLQYIRDGNEEALEILLIDGFKGYANMTDEQLHECDARDTVTVQGETK